ncbi:putative disease resistance protein RGA4 [Solanum lycopersicum]|uniref:putative disease resistance protein RGA4 n=1 Tax=Solanum lycopersicum TaxID=4081 RepID=UPI00374A47FD
MAATSFLFSIANSILGKLGCHALDAEDQESKNHELTNWLKELKDVLYDVDDFLDEIQTHVQQSQRYRMGYKLKEIRERLDSIAADLDKIGDFEEKIELVEWDLTTPYCSIAILQCTPTCVSVHYSGVVGRDVDRDTLIEALLKSGNEATLFVYPIVGVGGTGKTTLAKLVYNDPRIWDELQKLLMVGACGSKILVTTRKTEVASIMGTAPAYCLNGLSHEDSLTLFLRHLNKKKTERREWNIVNSHSGWNSNQNEEISSAVRVSYEQLSSYLKVCLAYCSIFPKGCVIEIDKLIQLVAEGLISKSNESEDLEHVAIQHFRELLSRSFFQDVEEYRSVYTSICTMHDLVHDLALSAAGVEFCAVNSHIQNISDEVRHVVFSEYDLSGKELPASLLRNQNLDVSSNGSIKELPDSINKLLSLQTLRISHCPQLEGLPKDIGNLISLRHLYITTKQACLPDKAIVCLSSLRSLCIHNCNNLVSLSEGLQHLTNLRTLAIIGCPRLTFFPIAMKHLTALENLLIVDCKELTLLEWQDIEGLRMLRSLVIGGLPELESKDVHCLGSLQMLVLAGLPEVVTSPRWLEGASATLQYLRVERCLNFAALPNWLANLTALEKLEISKCRKSFSLPEGMSCLTNLKVLKIDN